MNIKSLLIGSAAALAAVSGAQAADAIVAAEPEPMEYVRVCDAFGAGYFYIPGSETCLKINGYVRFQVDFGRSSAGANGGIYNAGANPSTTLTPAAAATQRDEWDLWTRGNIQFTAKTDTELGALTSYIEIQGSQSNDDTASSDNTFGVNQAYLQLGGLKAGWFNSYWDAGLAGETDDLASEAKFASIGYEYTADAFKVGLFVDEIEHSMTRGLRGYRNGYHNIGIEAQASATLGAVSIALLGGYDVEVEDGAIRAIATAAIGPGTLNVGGYYSTGVNVYGDEFEWALSASYALKATDKLTITPGYQYMWNKSVGGTSFTGIDDWKAGVLFDYQVVSGLNALVNVQYQDSADGVNGWFRLQRSF
jgi:hypothetical protein